MSPALISLILILLFIIGSAIILIISWEERKNKWTMRQNKTTYKIPNPSTKDFILAVKEGTIKQSPSKAPEQETPKSTDTVENPTKYPPNMFLSRIFPKRLSNALRSRVRVSNKWVSVKTVGDLTKIINEYGFELIEDTRNVGSKSIAEIASFFNISVYELRNKNPEIRYWEKEVEVTMTIEELKNKFILIDEIKKILDRHTDTTFKTYDTDGIASDIIKLVGGEAE